MPVEGVLECSGPQDVHSGMGPEAAAGICVAGHNGTRSKPALTFILSLRERNLIASVTIKHTECAEMQKPALEDKIVN
jgi:hypothetical protein